MTVQPEGSVLPRVGVDPLRMAAAAYLAPFKGQSRAHAETDLRAFLVWCAERGVDPLATRRPHVELYPWWFTVLVPSSPCRRWTCRPGKRSSWPWSPRPSG